MAELRLLLSANSEGTGRLRTLSESSHDESLRWLGSGEMAVRCDIDGDGHKVNGSVVD